MVSFAMRLLALLTLFALVPGMGFAQSAQAAGGASAHQDEPPRSAPQTEHGGDETLEVAAAGPLHFIGFTDLDFFASDDPHSAVKRGFSEGQFVLHLSSALSSRVSVFGEVAMTARRDANTSAAAPVTDVSVERVLLRFAASDALKLFAGRFHTPISRWNVQYHHGLWLQTTVSRPELVQFGGTFLPVHMVGASAEGVISRGERTFDYGAAIGNGRASVLSRPGDAGPVNDTRAWIGWAGLTPGIDTLHIGGAVYGDLISCGTDPRATRPQPGASQCGANVPPGSYREVIASAHVFWTREQPELLGEYVKVRHREEGSDATAESTGYYVQAAYRLPAPASTLKPYYRYEKIAVGRNDVVFGGVTSRSGSLAGIRWDFTDLAAIKVEYRRQRVPDEPYVNALFAQLSFTF